jgi:hypothetical protein
VKLTLARGAALKDPSRLSVPRRLP